MRRIQLYIYPILFTTLLAGCTGQFEVINKPGYEASEDDLSGDNFKLGMFFLQLQEYVVPARTNDYQLAENLIGSVYARYLMTTKSDWAKSNFSVFHVNDQWLNLPFSETMSKFYAPWFQIKQLTQGKGTYYALAQILRVAAMHRLTDLYGPIPYTRVNGNTLTSPYDSQETVYRTMLDELDAAIDTLTLFVSENPAKRPMIKFDRVYNGDFRKWIYLANSLKLRLAIRIRYADPALARHKAEEVINHPIGAILSNSDNAAYRCPKQNPLYTIAHIYQDTRVSADILSYMNGYEDPRRAAYFNTSVIEGLAGYHGLLSGSDYGLDALNLSFSTPAAQPADPLIWCTASEVAFLMAEAALLGWNFPETPQTYYERGIHLSFQQWNIAGYASYVESDRIPLTYRDPYGIYNDCGIKSKLTTRWNENTGFEPKLQRIITQKWIALWPLGQEAWSEYRRTGYPILLSIPQYIPIAYKVANRIPFPPAEYQQNSDHISDALLLLQGPDDFATRLWWDQKEDKFNFENKQ